MKSNSVQFKQYADVQTVVLGATGFIGRWVARSLCAAGAKLSLPVRDKVAAKEIFNQYDIQGDIYEVDFRDANSVYQLIKQISPTITFNLAGYGVDPSERAKELAYLINVRLIETVCEALQQTKKPNWDGMEIINVGSALEYGSIKGNLAEDSIPNPTTLYGKTKLAGTQALTEICQNDKIKGLTARLFTVYGPGELPGRLLPTLFKAAQNRESINLTAGLQKRDFVYVEDVAEGLLRLGLTSAEFGEAVNLATGKLSSVREFIQTTANLLSISPNRLKFGALPTRLEEMNHEPLSLERLQKLIGWIPQITIAEGVRKTSSFLQRRYQTHSQKT